MSTVSERSRNHAVGILFGRKHLHGCRASTNVLGTVRHEYASVEILDDDVQTAFDQLLAQLDTSASPTRIVAAVPTGECYFATRPINSGGGKASPRTLLRESLRSSAAKLDQLAIDVLNWQADKRPLVSIAAAPLDRIEKIRETVTQSQHSLQRMEPAANALIGGAVNDERKDRRDRFVTRVFVSESSVLAVMTKGARAIHWQSMPLPQGDEGTGIVSIVRSVEAAYSACGLESPPETVHIYGRRELLALIDRQWLSDNLPSDYRWLDSPSMKPTDIARCCAERLLHSSDDEFDFVREHREPQKFRRVFPYKETAIYLAVVVALVLILMDRLDQTNAKHVQLISNAPAIAAEGQNPRSERDRLNARAAAVSQFLDNRVQWSPLLGQITGVLPEGIRLTQISGSATMTQKRKKAVKSAPVTLVLNAECELDQNGQLPESVSGLTDQISQLESVQQHFQRVELGELRRTESLSSGVSGAQFSIILTNNTKAKG